MFESYYESSAYGEWCRRVYGKDLKQLGCVTMNELEILYREVNLSPDSHILDIGCGTGHISVEIATHYNSHLTGIDFDEGSITYAKKTFLNNTAFEFIYGDGSKICFEPSSFDLICLCDSLHFAQTLEELYSVLDKYMVMLKPDKNLVIFCNDYVIQQVLKWIINKCVPYPYKSFDLIETNKELWRNVFSELITMSSELQREIPDTYKRIKGECITKLNENGWMPRKLFIFTKK